MLRTRIAFVARPLIARRTFANTARTLAEGDTGGTRSGGSLHEDAFSKRRAASEDKWIRDEEQQKLKALAEKIGNAQKHMDELQKYINETVKGEGEKK